MRRYGARALRPGAVEYPAAVCQPGSVGAALALLLVESLRRPQNSQNADPT